MTFSHSLSTNNYGPSKFIVATSAANGTHTTLGSALTSASSGDTIFLRDSVTENITLKAGVNIVAWPGSQTTPEVSITGKCTMTTAGVVTISGIRLVTNSDFLLAVTGSATSVVNLEGCYLNCTNNTGISFTSSDAGAQVNLLRCTGDLGTTGIGLFASSSAGLSTIEYSRITNSGASVTASTVSAGTFQMRQSEINFPITTSGTSALNMHFSTIGTSGQNTTGLTVGGSGTNTSRLGFFICGSASAISISSNFSIAHSIISSSNTNAITGAGTLTYGGLEFIGTSHLTNVSTQTGDFMNVGGISFDAGNNSLANYETGTFTPAINNSSGAPTVTYTTQAGRYTRIGNRVVINLVLVLNAYTPGTGNVQITGLPFTSNSTANSSTTGAATLLSVTFGASVLYYNSALGNSATLMTLTGMRSAAGNLNLDAAGPTAGSTVRIACTYEV